MIKNLTKPFSLLIGANLYYFKPYNGWSLTKSVKDFSLSYRRAPSRSLDSLFQKPVEPVVPDQKPQDKPVVPVQPVVPVKAASPEPAVESKPVVKPEQEVQSQAQPVEEAQPVNPNTGQRQYVAREDPNKPKFEFKVETAETIFKEKDWSEPPVNQRFIFHNKMPKCGSTVFQKLLHKLSDQHKFTFMDVYEPGTRDQVN